MSAVSQFKLGGGLLVAGASIVLLMSSLWIFISTSPSTFTVVRMVFGSFIAVIFATPDYLDGTDIEHHLVSLLWLPWAGVYIAFLLWVGITVLRDRFNRPLAPVLAVTAVWLLLGTLYELVQYAPNLLHADFKVILVLGGSYLAMIAVVVGLGLIFFNYKQGMGVPVDREPFAGEMTPSRILFSFEGRIGRATFWLYQVLFINLIVVACVALGVALGGEDGLIAGYIVGLCLVIWPAIATSVKRCHDRNRSGAFVLISFIPFISIWYAIEVLFIKGTNGENKYGEDPLTTNEAV